ncbi:hypothetical protein T492DRAFT_1099553 [Pavlovales sp. CCMP2436]|nr:hypothetical protein T492DRAFT_1099553 [Pavlovales sp. CCMP2436]
MGVWRRTAGLLLLNMAATACNRTARARAAQPSGAGLAAPAQPRRAIVQPPIGRRGLAQLATAYGVLALSRPLPAAAAAMGAAVDANRARTVTIPLTDCGGSYCTVYRVDGSPFRAVVDTGSPFLSVAGSCTKRWGCYQGEGEPVGLEDSWETYDGREGNVAWRQGSLAFGSLQLAKSVVFGVLSDQLVGRPGGVFLGLVKYEAAGIRPTFLGQTPFQSFTVDLRDEPQLVLSTAPMVPVDARWIPMVDLRPFGSPVEHYATRISSLRVNGRDIRPNDGKSTFAIFDTGTTGMAISSTLWDACLASYEKGQGAPWSSTVDIDLPAQGGRPITVSVDRPFPCTPIQQIPWKEFDGHLVVLGLSFLEKRALTVDVDEKRIWLGYSS